jgi:hypothetical protein
MEEEEQPGTSSSKKSEDAALMLELPAGCFAHIISYLACLSDTAALQLACSHTSQQIQVSQTAISCCFATPAWYIGCRMIWQYVHHSPACAGWVLEAFLSCYVIP